MIIRELWTREDERALRQLRQALTVGDLAGALLAIDLTSEGDAQWCRDKIDLWAQRVRDVLESEDPDDQAEAMARVLGDELDFHGDSDDYYNPDNARLVEVMRRRRGMPIILSSVWMLIGQSAAIAVDGVGMPGHFLVRVGGAGGVYCDPFDGGEVRSVDDCREIVADLTGGQLEWSDDFLAPADQRSVVERILRNLTNSFVRQSDAEGLYRIVRLLSEIRPDLPEFMLNRARLTEEFGAPAAAVELYEQVTERFADSVEAGYARDRLKEVRRKRRMLN